MAGLGSLTLFPIEARQASNVKLALALFKTGGTRYAVGCRLFSLVTCYWLPLALMTPFLNSSSHPLFSSRMIKSIMAFCASAEADPSAPRNADKIARSWSCTEFGDLPENVACAVGLALDQPRQGCNQATATTPGGNRHKARYVVSYAP